MSCLSLAGFVADSDWFLYGAVRHSAFFGFFLVLRHKAPAVRISRSQNPTVRQSSVYLYRTILQVKTLVP